MFDNVGCVNHVVLGVPADGEAVRELAERMHASWVAVARDGDPGWPRYTPENPVVQRIDAEWTTTTTADWPERKLWHDIR